MYYGSVRLKEAAVEAELTTVVNDYFCPDDMTTY